MQFMHSQLDTYGANHFYVLNTLLILNFHLYLRFQLTFPPRSHMVYFNIIYIIIIIIIINNIMNNLNITYIIINIMLY